MKNPASFASANSVRGTLTNIQFARAFAATNVVLLHAIFNAETYGRSVTIFHAIRGWGGSGVDIFFVVSGFVMVFIQHRKNSSPLGFFKDRIGRIAPNYWLFCISIAALLLAVPKAFNGMTFSSNWILSSLAFSSQLIAQREPVVFVGWTIEYEMLFYLLFSMSLIVRNLRASICLVSAVIVVLTGVFGLPPLMLEFIFGMAIGWLYLKRKLPHSIAFGSLILGLSTFVLSILVKDMGVSRVLIYGLPSSLIILGCVNLRQMRPNFLTRLGDASYSIYLVQVLTIPAFYKGMAGSTWHADILVIACVVVTLAAGLVVYGFFEKPVQGFFKPRLA